MNGKLHPIILCICSYSDKPLTSRWFTQSALVKYLCCFHNTHVSKCFEDNIYLTQEKLLIRYPGKDHWCTSKKLEDYSHISKDIRNSYPHSVKWTEKRLHLAWGMIHHECWSTSRRHQARVSELSIASDDIIRSHTWPLPFNIDTQIRRYSQWTVHMLHSSK